MKAMIQLAVGLAIFPGLALIPLYLLGWVRTPFEIIVVGLLLFLVTGILWLSLDPGTQKERH